MVKMSILLGPYDKKGEPKAEDEDEDLFVFGYACKLYRDDVKAVMEDSGQLLIPWMGDSSLMVDRYDVRNKLEDKSQFGLKPNLPRRMSPQEISLEEELDRERYLALEWDDIRVAEQEEEEKKRKESGFSAIGFTYSSSTPSSVEPTKSSNLSLPEHLSTSYVDNDDQDTFIPPAGLMIPEGLRAPATNKLHSIIEKTASFVAKQGTQMEIIIKTKQKFNPYFSFLSYQDVLFPYYTHVKEMIMTGGYVPVVKNDASTNGSATRGGGMNRGGGALAPSSTGHQERKAKVSTGVVPNVKISSPKCDETSKGSAEPDSNSDTDEDSDSDDSDGGYLHPLLMKASLKTSKPSTPEPATSTSSPRVGHTPPPSSSATEKKLSVEELMSKSSFVARSLAINSAPSLNRDVATLGQATPTHATYSEADAVAAYEHYKQQYYESSSAGTDQDYGHGYYQPDPSLVSHDAYGQQYPPPNGAAQGTPYSDPYPPYYGHFPHPLPPPDLRPVIDKTAEYVAKNSDDFERTVLDRHIGDVRFCFLNPWDQYHNYYQAMKQYCKTRLHQQEDHFQALNPLPPMPLLASAQQEQEALKKPNLQKLSSSGAVSFKLQSKAPPTSSGLQFNVEGFSEEDTPSPEGSPQDPSNKDNSSTKTDSSEQPPPKKKQRLENGGAGHDHIENAVQEFLNMVKSEVGDEDTERMGSTVEAFLSTVKGMLGADTSN